MNDERLREMLQNALAPMRPGELERDLWPRMRARLEERPRGLHRLDWALVALCVACLLLFPQLIPALLYQL